MDDQLLPEQFKLVFEALPGAFLLLLPDPDFTIAGVSEAYLRATLRQRAELVGRPVFAVFPDNPDTPEANSTHNLSRSLQRVIATGQADVMAVQRYDVPRADGSGFEKRYWSPANAPVFDRDGRLLCIVHRVDNVTDYVALREEQARQRSLSERLNADNVKMEAEIVQRGQELDRLNEELRGANVVLAEYARRAREEAARKDEFLAMLAHELRNPLAAIASALQLWSVAPADERRRAKLLGICERQVGNLTRLVDDLLEMSRIDRGAVELQRAPLDLRGLRIATRIAPGGFAAYGDATRLEQALSNLLTNAAKYSEPGAHVELSLEPVLSGDAPWARIEVRDEGRGIPPDKLEAIFDMFVQVDVSLDRSRGGLGIGLALVRAIVELHGGRVAAWSRGLGHGSSFTIELPLTPQLVHGPQLERRLAAAAAPLPPPSGGMRRILIVEDNADARETLKELLGASGYLVSAVDNGADGLERIVGERPDLAIVDVGLPGLDGFEVARRARAAVGPATRLVAFTGYNSPAVRAAALEAGFDMHVSKPCTAERLAEVLRPRPDDPG